MGKLISIITITFNAERTIGDTLKSLREQSFRDFEHIIVDGASTDRTLEIVRTLGAEDVRILSEKDRGLYDAMNKGLLMAKAPYVLFLNSGDRFSSPEELHRYAEAVCKGADIVYGDTQLVDCDGNVIGPRHLSVPERLTFDSFKRGMLVCHQAFLVRKDIAPMYDLQYRFSADYDWCLGCLEKAEPDKCVNLHRVTINYLTEGLTDKNKIASLKERYRIMCRRYGVAKATLANLSFIPRMVNRMIKHGNI